MVLIAPHDRDEAVDGVRLRHVPKPRGRLARMLGTTLRVGRAALAEKADLYHLHDPELLPVGRFLRLLGKRVVFDMHENLPKAMLSKPWAPGWLRPPLSCCCRLAERMLLGPLPVVFAETSYEADYPWVRSSRVVLNLPVLPELPDASDKHRAPTLGYVGGVSADRGSQLTLEALSLLKASGLEVGFECVGPATAEHAEELAAQVARSALRGFRAYGRMPASEAWRVMARCHIGLAVLKPLPNFVESFPTKMFEYMAMGLPVIVSDAPLYRGVVESAGCGLCVDPDDARALADAIRTLVEDPAEATAMGRRGQQAVRERYNWDSEFEKLQALYRETLGVAARERQPTNSGPTERPQAA